MLVIKSELYDIIACTSLGIVPVHYTFMYMGEREDNSRLVKTRILLISVYDVKTDGINQIAIRLQSSQTQAVCACIYYQAPPPMYHAVLIKYNSRI